MSRTFDALQRVEDRGQSSEPTPTLIPTRVVKQPPLKLPVTGDEIVKFVQRVFLPSMNGTPRTVVFSSLEHEVGCTSVCAGAALTIADQVNARVCLVDGNLRKPSLHRYFDLENGPGLGDALVQSGAIRELTHRVADSSLWVLPSGTTDSKVDALLNSELLPSRIAELRRDFDYVLIDAPPVNLYSDAQLLGRASEGIVLVLELGATRRELARNLKASLDGHVRVLGAVLNKRKFHIPQSVYEKFF